MNPSAVFLPPNAARIAWASLAVLLNTGCGSAPEWIQPPLTTVTTSAVESIHVVRSLRVERTLVSSWCTTERTGFAPLRGPSLMEDRFSLHSIDSDARSGRLTDPLRHPVGELRTCFGNTANPGVFNFYAQGIVADIPVTGSGECAVVQPNHAEEGVTSLRCFLRWRDLPEPYTGGFLTSSTVSSKAVLGLDTDPPGYVHSSIATIRLWRRRGA